jgi:hypothetical protein
VAVIAVGTISSPPSASSIRVRPTAGSPGAPTGVRAAAHDRGALVAWTAPTTTGDGIGHYTATATYTGTRTDVPDGRVCVTPNATTLSCDITELINLVDYQITVVAVGRGASGNSGPSTPPVTVRPHVIAAAPTIVRVVPGILALSVQLTPGPAVAGAAVSNYTATAVGGPATSSCVAPVTTASTTSCIISGLAAGATYTVTVVANASIAANGSLPSEPSIPTRAVAWPAPTLPSAAPAAAGPVTSSPASPALDSTATLSGSGYAPFTGITVGLYQGTVLRTTWPTITDGTGAFSVPVTMSGTGVTAGSATIVAGGMQSSGVVRYTSLAMTIAPPTVLSAVFSALARTAGLSAGKLPAADFRRRSTLTRSAP